MSPLLLICDPHYDYSRTFHELLERREIDTLHVRDAKECLAAVRLHTPRFVLMSDETDRRAVTPLLDDVIPSARDRPIVFVAGDNPRWQLARDWDLPRERCLRTPLDEEAFVALLASLPGGSSTGIQEEDEEAGFGRRSAGIAAYDNEGGYIAGSTIGMENVGAEGLPRWAEADLVREESGDETAIRLNALQLTIGHRQIIGGGIEATIRRNEDILAVVQGSEVECWLDAHDAATRLQNATASP